MKKLYNVKGGVIKVLNKNGSIQTIIIIALIGVILVGGYFLFIKNGGEATTGNETEESSSEEVSEGTETAGQSDGGSGTDAGNSTNTALSISSGFHNAELTSEDVVDIYKISADSGDIMKVTMTPNGFDAVLKIAEKDELSAGFAYGGIESDEGMEGENETLTYITSDGYYFIAVYSTDYAYASPTGGSYTLNISVQSQNDADSGGDAPSDSSQAVNLEAGTYSGYTGGFSGAGDLDFYAVSVTGDQTISVTATPEEGLDISLGVDEKPDWASVLPEDNKLSGDAETVNKTSPDDDIYYITVKKTGGSKFGGSYDLQVNVE